MFPNRFFRCREPKFRFTTALAALLLLFAPMTNVAQTVEQVKNSNAYYWGEGVGKTTSQADEAALTMLIGSISVNVESKFSVHTEETTHNKKSDFKEYVNSIVNTYSNATIKNTEILSWGEEPQVHVFRFVKKAEVSKIFAEREAKIREFTDIAQRAETKTQVADALRYYYWALMLLQSHPDATTMTVVAGGKQQRLDVLLPARINAIFEQLRFAVTGKQRDGNITQYILHIAYNGSPAASCDYSFFDGRSQSVVVSAKDGLGMGEMVGDTTLHKSLRVKVEYAFENEWKIDNEVNDVLRKVDPVIFKKSYVDVPIAMTRAADKTTDKPAAQTAAQPIAKAPATAASAKVEASLKTVNGQAHITMLERVEKAIRSKNYDAVRDCFTDDGFDIFTRLVSYGNAVLLAKPAYSFLEFEDGILVRSMPMRFTFRNNRRAFVEDVVLNISQREGKIRSLSFALPNKVCNDILRYESWEQYSRIAIINFVENYKTAYALKRLDYIESIFSNNALIIVGKIVKPAPTNDSRAINPQLKLTQYSKGQYMRQLSTVFRSNEYVNLKFTDVSVKKAGAGGEVYGIQLQQDYFSTTYGDKGYLFLMVDLNKPEMPIIHVRTWQPEKDPEFGLYDISQF